VRNEASRWVDHVDVWPAKRESVNRVMPHVSSFTCGEQLTASEDQTPKRSRVPVINLLDAPGKGMSWGRSRLVVYSWAVFELLFVYNPWQVSSAVRVLILRLFGAQIGSDVIFRPRTRVKFPWNLEIGDRSWIGEGVWIHNQDRVSIGHDVSISQETMLTTGSHAHRRDMALITRPIRIEPGVWLTSRCIVLGGSHIGRSVLARPMTVVSGIIAENSVVAGPDSSVVGVRFVLGSAE